jgi:predicted ATPase/DNA-binding XRE family transcriptional regulator
MDGVPSFGAWLKRRRLTLGLTQVALADTAGCSLVTLRKLEADERRPSGQLAERLARNLALPDHQRAAFVACARGLLAGDRLPLPETLDTNTPRLPAPPSALVGRDAELAACRELLDSGARLLTLVGPPGIGKTRLALALAHARAPQQTHGAFFVALAPLSDPALVPGAIAQALELRARGDQPLVEQLGSFLRAKHTMLVLDNFEQLLEAAPVVGELLAAAPQLTVIATSRASLRLHGEHIYPVGPLAEEGGIVLFVARARAVRHGFARTATNEATLGAIVHRLDGLPLAIELAAARVRHFTPEALLARLTTHGLGELRDGPRDAPARQQTVRDCIAWSYALLNEEEQRLFRRLAVFVGGFTAEAADAVLGSQFSVLNAATQHATLEVLASLVDHSLVVEMDGASEAPRYTLLELVREYALEQLREAGEEQEVRRAHAKYFARFVEHIAPTMHGPHQHAALDTLEREHDNIRAVLVWSRIAATESDREVGVEIIGAMWGFWYYRHRAEGEHWLDAATATTWARMPTIGRARVLSANGHVKWARDEHGIALSLLDEALTLARAHGDQILEAEVLNHIGEVQLVLGELDQAETNLQHSLQLSKQSANLWREGWALYNLGTVSVLRNNLEQAQSFYQRSLDVFEQVGDPWAQANPTAALADMAQQVGNDSLAEMLYIRVGDLFGSSDPVGRNNSIVLRGILAHRRGDSMLAVDLLQSAYISAQGLGDNNHASFTASALAAAYLGLGNIVRARDTAQHALLIALKPRSSPWGISEALIVIAAIASQCQPDKPVVQVLGFDESFRKTHKLLLASGWLFDTHARVLAACRAALGNDAFEAAWEAGRALTLD